MNLIDSILSANGGKAVGQIAKQVGIPEEVAQKAVSALAPALARGLQRNAAKAGGADALAGALKTGNHARYVDQPDTIGKAESIADGNAILGHILGSKDVSRNVAGNASKQTGIDASILRKVLPMVAGVAMGSLAKQGGGVVSGGGGPAGSKPLDMLESLLDSDKDGSATDDVLDLAKKFF
jgi:hypothetical protein